MKIGIIGASLSGLVAGDRLARAGHDVTIIEKGRSLGGRLATRTEGTAIFDYGIPFLKAEGNRFKNFIDELVSKNILQKWAENFHYYNGNQLYETNPYREDNEYFAAKKGLNEIALHLKRWVDIKSEVQAGGLTYIGADRSKKPAWMINLTDISVFECDAVVLATPAPVAYGLLNTAQDETPVKRIIRVIDEVQYEPCYTLMASYKGNTPDWKGIECKGDDLRWMGNESSKSGEESHGNIVIHSSRKFVKKHYNGSEEQIKQALLEHAANIGGAWLGQPQQSMLHFWKYYKAIKPVSEYFMEMEMEDAPLVLIGDYLNDNTAEAAYESASYLADYWIEKYEARTLKV